MVDVFMIDTTNKRIEELENLISDAAPLTWVANQDMEGANRWEKRALLVLQSKKAWEK